MSNPTAEQSYEQWDQTPQEVIDAARLLLEWAGPMKAWSVMGIGVSDHGEVQERLSQQLAVNCNLRTELAVAQAEIAALKKPMVCYWPCDKHMGMPFTMKVGYSPPVKSVCPICEPPA